MNRSTTSNPQSAGASVKADITEPEHTDLVAQIGREVAGALTSALERVNALATTGRIERSSLRLLREEIERARRSGMLGQQVARLASGRVQVSEERLDLTAQFREALSQRNRERTAKAACGPCHDRCSSVEPESI